MHRARTISFDAALDELRLRVEDDQVRVVVLGRRIILHGDVAPVGVCVMER